MFKDSKIYVAGHTGLLGSALIRRLRDDGHENLITQTHDQLDLTDKSCVYDFFLSQKPDYVFLAAGKVGGIAGNRIHPADYLHINISIQDNVFEAAQKLHVKNLVFYGSSCSYPKASLQPIKEEYLLTGAIEQTSEAYAAAKIAGIIACRAYNAQYRTNRFIALIPASIYGPGDNFDLENSHVLSALIKRLHEAKVNNAPHILLWGSGEPKREFIFCEDIAEASFFAIQNVDKLKNHHYNVGTSHDYTIKNLAEKIAEIIGYRGEILWDKSKPDGARQKLLDSHKFMSLGWKPGVGFEYGLQKTYEWFLSKNNL
jgi:GDP-L-fucose synthase